MIYAIGAADSAYRMMSLANSQMSALRNINQYSNMEQLHRMDNYYSMNIEKEKLNYKMLNKLDKMNKKIVEEKFKNR